LSRVNLERKNMGNAFHKKQIPLGRGGRTRGTGIRYTDAPLPAQPTGAPKTPVNPSVRDWNVYCLMTLAARALDDWEDVLLAERGVERDLGSERIVDKALTASNTAITRHCDHTGINIDSLLAHLGRRSADTRLSAALAFVGKRFTEVFDRVGA
jgi:hypothetical protein